MDPLVVLLLLMAATAGHSQSDEYGPPQTLRLWISVDETLNQALATSAAGTGRIADLANHMAHVMKQANVHIQVVNVTVRGDPADSVTTFDGYFRDGMREYLPPDGTSDFYQVWTGKSFVPGQEQRQHAVFDSQCHITSYSLVSFVDGDGRQKRDDQVIHDAVKSLAENLGLRDCDCPTGPAATGCVLTHGHDEGSFLPQCVRQQVDRKFGTDSQSCLSRDPDPSLSFMPICGNGVVESGEECDCHAQRLHCWNCCTLRCKKSVCIYDDMVTFRPEPFSPVVPVSKPVPDNPLDANPSNEVTGVPPLRPIVDQERNPDSHSPQQPVDEQDDDPNFLPALPPVTPATRTTPSPKQTVTRKAITKRTTTRPGPVRAPPGPPTFKDTSYGGSDRAPDIGNTSLVADSYPNAGTVAADASDATTSTPFQVIVLPEQVTVDPEFDPEEEDGPLAALAPDAFGPEVGDGDVTSQSDESPGESDDGHTNTSPSPVASVTRTGGHSASGHTSSRSGGNGTGNGTQSQNNAVAAAAGAQDEDDNRQLVLIVVVSVIVVALLALAIVILFMLLRKSSRRNKTLTPSSRVPSHRSSAPPPPVSMSRHPSGRSRSSSASRRSVPRSAQSHGSRPSSPRRQPSHRSIIRNSLMSNPGSTPESQKRSGFSSPSRRRDPNFGLTQFFASNKK